MIATFNFHIDGGLTLKVGADGHTVALYSGEEGLFPIGYVYMDRQYEEAVQNAVDAFNRAFCASIANADLRGAA